MSGLVLSIRGDKLYAVTVIDMHFNDQDSLDRDHNNESLLWCRGQNYAEQLLQAGDTGKALLGCHNFEAWFQSYLGSDGWFICACGLLVTRSIKKQWENDNPIVKKVLFFFLSVITVSSIWAFPFIYVLGCVLSRSALYDLTKRDIFSKKNPLVWRYRMCALCRNCALIYWDKIQRIFSFDKPLKTIVVQSIGNLALPWTVGV